MASKVYQFVYYLMHMKIKRKKGEWGQCEGEQGLTNESWLTISWITINNITEAFQWGEIAQIHSAQMRLGWKVSGPTTSAWMDREAFVHGREKRAILLLSHIEICENRRRGGSFFADFYNPTLHYATIQYSAFFSISMLDFQSCLILKISY